MGFLSFFGLKLFNPEEFDKKLTGIAQSISKTRNQIATLKRKKSSFRRALLCYFAICYVAYVAYRYKVASNNLGVLANSKSRFGTFVGGQLAVDLAYVSLSPFAFAFLIYIVNTVFLFWIRAKNSQLESLSKKHKEKIEELKRVTNFNSTNKLLEKYSSNGPPKQQPAPVVGPASQRQEPKSQPEKTASSQIMGIPTSPKVSNQAKSAAKPTTSVAPQKRTISDRLLDFIIGSDHNETVESRYALICVNCFTHNGLAAPGVASPSSVTYICRNCGYINGHFNEPSPSTEKQEKHSIDKQEWRASEKQEVLSTEKLVEPSTEKQEEPSIEKLGETAAQKQEEVKASEGITDGIDVAGGERILGEERAQRISQ